MRFISCLSIALLTTALAMSSAMAQARNVGSTSCRETFSCSQTPQDQINTIANNCSVMGFGISTQTSGIFDGATPDGNNCVTGHLTSTRSAQCCTIADGDTCSLHCTLQ